MSSSDANKIYLEIDQDYTCPDDIFFGVPIANTSLKFEGCPLIIVSWQKSCGKDSIRKLDIETLIGYSFDGWPDNHWG